MFTSAAALALYGVIFGGVGAKFLELWFGKGKVKEDIAAALRKELRDDIIRYRAVAAEAEKEADELREKYYELQEELATARAAQALNTHKVNEVAKVVDKAHPEANLKNKVLELPDKN
jgi:ribosomal protein L29